MWFHLRMTRLMDVLFQNRNQNQIWCVPTWNRDLSSFSNSPSLVLIYEATSTFLFCLITTSNCKQIATVIHQKLSLRFVFDIRLLNHVFCREKHLQQKCIRPSVWLLIKIIKCSLRTYRRNSLKLTEIFWWAWEKSCTQRWSDSIIFL